MYINEPGDLDEEEDMVKAQKAEDFDALIHDEKGGVAKSRNWQHRGPGVI